MRRENNILPAEDGCELLLWIFPCFAVNKKLSRLKLSVVEMILLVDEFLSFCAATVVGVIVRNRT